MACLRSEPLASQPPVGFTEQVGDNQSNKSKETVV